MAGTGARASGGLRSSRLGSSRLGSSLARGGGARRRARASLRFSRLRGPQDAALRGAAAAAWADTSTDASASVCTSFAQGVPARCPVATAATAFGAAAGVRPPPLTLTVLGKRWSVDVLAVVHNAILFEVGDLFDMLTALVLGSKRARTAELRAFFAWFATFEAFVVTALKAEEEVLYPWLEQWGRIDGALSTGARIAAKGGIVRSVRDASAAAALLGLHHLPAGGACADRPGDALSVGFADVAVAEGVAGAPEEADAELCKRVLDAVVGHVVAFSNALADYFREQDEALPDIIEALYDREDVYSSAVDRRCVRAIWRSGRRDEATLILVRGLGGDRALARAWAHRCLRRIDRMSLPLWRRRYQSGRGAVVERFRSRKSRYEQLLALDGHPLVSDNRTDVPRNMLSTPHPAASAMHSRARVRRTISDR